MKKTRLFVPVARPFHKFPVIILGFASKQQVSIARLNYSMIWALQWRWNLVFSDFMRHYVCWRSESMPWNGIFSWILEILLLDTLYMAC